MWVWEMEGCEGWRDVRDGGMWEMEGCGRGGWRDVGDGRWREGCGGWRGGGVEGCEMWEMEGWKDEKGCEG